MVLHHNVTHKENMDKLTRDFAENRLKKIQEEDPTIDYVQIFSHESLKIILYKPVGEDKQGPHIQDEVYVIARGTAKFKQHEPCEAPGAPIECVEGQVIFVPAGSIHKFTDIDANFATWAFFYGPKDGEKKLDENMLLYKKFFFDIPLV